MRIRTATLSIRNKLFLSYLALVLFALGLFLAVNTVLVTRENKQQVLRTAQHVFAQERANLEYRTESARNTLYELTTNEALQQLFARDRDYYESDIGRWPIDYQTFQKISYSAGFTPGIVSVRLIMRDGLASVFENQNIVSLAGVTKLAWYHDFEADNRRLFWHADPTAASAGAVRMIHADMGIFDPENMAVLDGIVELDIAASTIQSTLDDALLSPSAISFLVDERGNVFASARTVPGSSEDALAAAVTAGARPPAGSGDGFRTVRTGARTFLVGSRSVANSDWTLVLAVPFSDIAELSARPARIMALVFLFLIPLTGSLAFYASRSATKRIRNLIRNMDRVVRGDFSATLDPGSPDELGHLTERFNFMISEVEQLLDDKYALGIEVKNLELKALQAQINPHFLYNTLDLINWMAIRRNAGEIEELVAALSTFYKLSLSRGEDVVTIRDEIEHAKTYVYIQNLRFDNAVDFSVSAERDLLDRPILKLVIQPLVENAIFHGIMMKPEERGQIRLEVQRDRRDELDDILVRVKDDGPGMSQEQLVTIQNGAQYARDFHGYGVRNIHSRIELRYGTGYGLTFESAPGRGTVACIRIPATDRTETARPSVRSAPGIEVPTARIATES